MFNTQILAGSSGQGGVTQQSLKFNDDDSQYLSWTPAAAGNRKTWTWSGWVKLAQGLNNNQSTIFGIGGSSSGDLLQITGGGNGLFRFFQNGGNTTYIVWSGVLRDVSAWYHIVLAEDTTQATSSNRIKLYLNGEQLTSFSTEIYPSQNYEGGINNSVEHRIGRDPNNEYSYFDGYLSDIHFIDGQALDPTSFGQFTNGYWEKIDYAGSYGTNGFHLTFQDDVVSEGFNAVTYTGNGGTQSISGLGLSPDLVWIKERSSTSGHQLVDTVRGAGKRLVSNGTVGEGVAGGMLTSFDGDGFSIGNDGAYNENGQTYVGWAWDAGSGSAASNTNGTITSTVKANPAYGFSVVSYTSPNNAADQTVGHGLSQAPEAIICKNLDTTYNWDIYHSGTGSVEDTLTFTTAGTRNLDVFTTTAPTSTVFGTKDNFTHAGTNRYIAYCFHSVAGYSYISSYSGTGANGHKITTGFSPAFIMLKRYDSGSVEDWLIYDNTRNPANLSGNEYVLRPNTNGAEQAYGSIDFESDGFTLQTVGGALNASGGNYIVMAFADTREAAFWKDVSGQGNHWTPNNLDYRDSLPDSPANNFAVMSSIHPSSSNFTISDGNLSLSKSGTGTFGLYSQSLMPTTGKWYFEVCITGRGTSDRTRVGLANYNSVTGTSTIQSSYSGVEISTADADKVFIVQNGSTTENDTFYTALSDNDVVRFAVDMDNGRLYIGVNGNWWNYNTSQTGGDPTSGSGYVTNSTTIFDGSPMTAYSGFSAGTTTSTGQTFNFGQDSTFSGAKPMGAFTDANSIGNFQYAPPAGYLALCTANLPTPTIVDGSEHFNTVLYTGTGATRSITGVGFQPDWVWGKARNHGYSHWLYDSVRGAEKLLRSDLTSAEATQGQGLTAFNADGFSLGTTDDHNENTKTFASWNWKAGGTAASNTDGSITSQVSANVDAGFSVATFTTPATGTGFTVGHGLGVKPSMLITRQKSSGSAWWVWHKDFPSPNTNYLYLHEAFSIGDLTQSTNSWDNTQPTTSVWSQRSDWAFQTNQPAVCYAFADVEGYLKAGSYTGNGSSDGPFVYTGFRPAWIMWKRTDSSTGGEWVIQDTTRREFNPVNVSLYPNLANAEATGETFRVQDTLSNGFKLRSSAAQCNASGGTYIYLAFAETPLKFATAR
jgi:hypothetical protein